MIETYGVKTYHNGIKMRSGLENRVANLLDTMKIKYEYEPKYFKLTNGSLYVPDFYLTDMKLFVEVKPFIEEDKANIKKMVCLCNDNKIEGLIITPDEILFLTWYTDLNDKPDGFVEIEPTQLILCSHCKKYSFIPLYASYHCRNCNTHEGDHDIVLSGSTGRFNDKLTLECVEHHVGLLSPGDRQWRHHK